MLFQYYREPQGLKAPVAHELESRNFHVWCLTRRSGSSAVLLTMPDAYAIFRLCSKNFAPRNNHPATAKAINAMISFWALPFSVTAYRAIIANHIATSAIRARRRAFAFSLIDD